MLAAFERASARGARRIELDTNEHNHAAIALYESLGFSSTSKAHGSLTGRDLFMGRQLSLSRARFAACRRRCSASRRPAGSAAAAGRPSRSASR